jgi:hypothetical protein
MKVYAQSALCPSQVLFAFDDVVDATVVRIRCAVAYSTRRGSERLVQRIAARMGHRPWNNSEKHFVTSLDFGLTEPGALEYLEHLPGSTVHVANPQVLATPGMMPARAYHPKLYLFDTAVGTGFVVGSANLTDSALVANTEVVAAGRERPSNSDWDRLWQDLLLDTSPLTGPLLDEYHQKWKRTGRKPAELDLTPSPPKIAPGQKPVFWDAISGGGLEPTAFNQFWVEAGSMSSGGSHNQLELPRGANRFFGFRHTNYGAAHITVGHPPLTLRGRTWTNRPLTWHGNNKMERINLPTAAQGGFNYRATAVLFRRQPEGFEITAVPWNDASGVAWRAASSALGTVFRLGERGHRICGLF